MRHNKISLPDKPVSNPIRIPNDELGSLSSLDMPSMKFHRFDGILDARNFYNRFSGNWRGLDLCRGASRVRCPEAKGSAIGALFIAHHA
jgi:hypothetical protein